MACVPAVFYLYYCTPLMNKMTFTNCNVPWYKRHMSENHSRGFIICYLNSTFTFWEFYKISIITSFTVLKFIINLALFFSFPAFSEVFLTSLHLQISIIRLTTTLVLYIYFHEISFFYFLEKFCFLELNLIFSCNLLLLNFSYS